MYGELAPWFRLVTHPSDPDDETCRADYVYMIREPGKAQRTVNDTHTIGLTAAVFVWYLAW